MLDLNFIRICNYVSIIKNIFLYQDIQRNCIGRKVKSKDLNSINTFISRMQDDQLTKGHYCLSMKKIVVI